MAESNLRLPVDGAGKRLQTFTHTEGADEVHAEAIVLVDEAGDTTPLTNLANLDIALSALRDALETISVGNFPADYPDVAATAKLEAIRLLLAGTLNIAGAVSVSNFPATQPVSGPLTDAQLRATPVPVSGTFYPGTQPVSATDLDTRDLSLSQDNVRQTTRPMTAVSVSKTGPLTDDVLVAVSPGSRLRLLRNAGHCDPATPAGTYPVITLKIGATTIYSDKLEAGLPWAETVCFEGADGDDLTLDLTTTQTVYLNMRYELFAA